MTHRIVMALVLLVTIAPALQAQDEVKDPRAKKEVAEIAKAVGGTMTYFESKNFTWASCLSADRTNRIIAGAEKAFEILATDLGVESWRQVFDRRRPMGVILKGKKQFKAYNEWFVKNHDIWSPKDFLKSNNPSDFYTSYATRQVMVSHKSKDQRLLQSIFAHLVGHLISNSYKYNQNWTPGWLEEAMGLYAEAKVYGVQRCECVGKIYGRGVRKAELEAGYKTKKWQSRIKQRIGAGHYKNISALWRLRLGELTADDAGKGYAIICWMTREPKKLGRFLKRLKSAWPSKIEADYQTGHGTAHEKARKAAFDLTPSQLDEAVLNFVVATF